MAPRNKAVAKAIDTTDVMSHEEFPAPNTRRSPWSELLEELWEKTENGEVEAGMYVKLGSFKNANGARTQIRALEKKGYALDFDFQSVTRKGEGSTLWGRAK